MKPTSIALAAALLATPAWSATYLSNGNSGFGGVLSSLDITDNGTDITFTLNRGDGGLNDSFVLYIDSVAGGATSTVNFDDTGDDLRRAISGYDGFNRATVEFSSGFEVDHAIALDQGFAGLWTTADGGSHGFVTTVNGSTGGSTQPSYTMTATLVDLGLNPGDSFEFVGTYLNENGAFRSDEAFGDGIPSGNPGTATVTFSASRVYTTVPEPSIALLGGLGFLALLRRRR